MPLSWGGTPLRRNDVRGVIAGFLNALFGVTALGAAPALAQPAAVRTAADLSAVLSPVSLPPFAAGSAPSGARTVTVDTSATNQTFVGVGAALTEAACYNLMTRMTAVQRAAILQEAFGTNGLSVVRISFGDSDFGLNTNAVLAGTGGFKSYDDVAGDTSLASFSIGKEAAYVLPVLQQVLAINPSVRVIASVWSPPVQFKSSGATLTTGSFSETTANFQGYASYLVKAIQGFAAQGVPIYAVSIQNEPGYANAQGGTSGTPYPSCSWSSAGMTTFIGSFLGPGLANANLATAVISNDDSFTNTNGISTPIGDPTAKGYIGAVGVHGYYGAPSSMPNAVGAKPWWLTEVTGYQPAGPATTGYLASLYVDSMFYGASALVSWNFVLDTAGKPGPDGDKSRPVLYVDKAGSGAIIRNADYYLLAHIAKYVQRGAVKVSSTSFAHATSYAQPGADVMTVAFKNPDGSVVLLIFNGAASAQLLYVNDAQGGVGSSLTVGAGDFVTAVFKNPPAIATAAPTHAYVSGTSTTNGGCYANSTAANDSAAIDARIWFKPDSLTPANNAQLIGKFNDANASAGSNSEWVLQLGSDGVLGLIYYDGSGNYKAAYALTGANTGNGVAANGSDANRGLWLRAVVNPTSTAYTDKEGVSVPANIIRFYKAADVNGEPGSWLQLGADQPAQSTAGIAKKGANAPGLGIMSVFNSQRINARVFKVRVYDLAVSNATLFNPDFTSQPSAGGGSSDVTFLDSASNQNGFTIYHPSFVS